MRRGQNAMSSADYRSGFADVEAWEVAPAYYAKGDAATYHADLSADLADAGWEPEWIVQANMDVAEGLSNQAVGAYGPASESRWSELNPYYNY